MADIKLSNVIKRYANATVIHGVDLEVKDGEGERKRMSEGERKKGE